MNISSPLQYLSLLIFIMPHPGHQDLVPKRFSAVPKVAIDFKTSKPLDAPFLSLTHHFNRVIKFHVGSLGLVLEFI
jgi:hypothetical protein